jgi:predicted PhzF superfamily epimerase YddE/YHI9
MGAAVDGNGIDPRGQSGSVSLAASICRQRFGFNQLAVFPEAQGLTDRQMQEIARRSNFSETTALAATQ